MDMTLAFSHPLLLIVIGVLASAAGWMGLVGWHAHAGPPIKILGLAVAGWFVALTIDPLVGSVGMLVLSTALAFLAAQYWFQRNQAVKERDRIALEHLALVARVTEIETQSHVLAQAMLPVTAAFQALLVKELTHYHTPEMDALMVKLGPPLTLTEPEAERLAMLLEQRTRDVSAEITASERDAALMMPAVMRRVRAETLAPPPPTLRLVAMTAVVESVDGERRALLIPTQSTEGTDRDILTQAIIENTRLTREANDVARRAQRNLTVAPK